MSRAYYGPPLMHEEPPGKATAARDVSLRSGLIENAKGDRIETADKRGWTQMGRTRAMDLAALPFSGSQSTSGTRGQIVPAVLPISCGLPLRWNPGSKSLGRIM